MRLIRSFLILLCLFPYLGFSQVSVGLDRIFNDEPYLSWIRGKNITLISHHAAVNQEGKDALSAFLEHRDLCSLNVLCTLEHGYYGTAPAETPGTAPRVPGLHIVSLYGVKEVPEHAVQGSDVLIYDVQDIGVRSYTFVTSLLHLVRAAQKYKKNLIILDRPNPMGGKIVDGPMPLSQSEYAPEIPYCYGMTPGELALFYKAKYAPYAEVSVVPMQGWKRSMTFSQTGLNWIPTSPQIPDPQTAFFYAATGIIGALSISSIGIGYTLPFRLIGAPWMDGHLVAKKLNEARLPGVIFYPFCYEPFFGKYKMELCSGVLLVLDKPGEFLPMETQSTILGTLKTLYPKHVENAFNALEKIPLRKNSIYRCLGEETFLHICQKERYIIWPLKRLCNEGRTKFQSIRKPFLIADYGEEE
ncbi:exo-beta-N-acetylmuramidase NamZ domain-containing protein [Chlamydia abortus]|uniref:DUF1343 domain-containing protein n=1 Tax=Chlamydia abortus TaxID=83555 RepID=UPI00029CADB2|nr:exo-beta-N-acetylmuramidase NamZ domain-containing protein [Chlamydia abortus]EGK69680.1 hypothetical protein CAB1_0974 [Chlamydia abortus LLG]QEM74271.1 DUF1343 domain-containing protein [Chlamydia abortus]SFV99280.1 Uncharacterized protein conserved in bacteria [Chlamydia abortus]